MPSALHTIDPNGIELELLPEEILTDEKYSVRCWKDASHAD